MIIYFSGTGNSRFLAKLLAERGIRFCPQVDAYHSRLRIALRAGDSQGPASTADVKSDTLIGNTYLPRNAFDDVPGNTLVPMVIKRAVHDRKLPPHQSGANSQQEQHDASHQPHGSFRKQWTETENAT